MLLLSLGMGHLNDGFRISPQGVMLNAIKGLAYSH